MIIDAASEQLNIFLTAHQHNMVVHVAKWNPFTALREARERTSAGSRPQVAVVERGGEGLTVARFVRYSRHSRRS